MKVFFNGNIITMENGLMPKYIITNKDKIVKVGFDDVPNIDAEYIDLHHKTLLPAFIDTHSHFLGVAVSLLKVNLSECYSFLDIKNTIEKFILENNIKKGEWIFACNYDQNQLQEKRHPDGTFIDQYFKDYCVWLDNASSHVGCFNIKALSYLTGKLIENENVKTYYEEDEYFELIKKIPPFPLEKILEKVKVAQELYFKQGYSTFQEGAFKSSLIPLYQEIIKRELLIGDVVGYIDYNDFNDVYGKMKNYVGKNYVDHFRLGGIKVFLDGSPQNKTAYLKKPYLGEKTYVGYKSMSDEDLYCQIKKARDTSLQILAHANGDAAIRQFIDQCQKVKRIDLLRPVLIHAQLMDINDLIDVKNLGIIVSYFNSHVKIYGDTHIKNLGLERAKRISPLNSTLKENIKFTLHQDYPVMKLDVMSMLDAAVNRVTKNNVILGKEEKIDIYEALKAITINAAFQYGEENKKGSIALGKEASFVVLNDNPLKIEKNKINQLRVILTMVKGKIVYNEN